MPEVSVQIANRNYELACGDGEEERVQELAAYVDEKVTDLRRQLPGTPEVKLLVFAALILAGSAVWRKRLCCSTRLVAMPRRYPCPGCGAGPR